MKVVSYKMFGSTEEFEKWQIENDEIGILSISPMVGGIGGNLHQESEIKSDYEFETSINVFVTFLKEV